MNIDKLKKAMADSLPEKVLKDIDGRASSQAPWKSHSKFKGNKFKKRRDSTHFCDDPYEEEEDANAAEEEEEYSTDDGYEAWLASEDADQVAYVDEEGWFYSDEDTINAVDESMAHDDEEYSQQVVSFTEARNALAKARVAR